MSPTCACLLAWLATNAPEKPVDTLPKVEANEALAREAWDKGAKAFSEGRLEDAIGYFEQTYRYSGRPGPLFSLGQAHRHLYEKTNDEAQRQLAIRRYRRYLEEDPKGPRRLEAERWIQVLQKEGDELEGIDQSRIFTRLSLSSRTAGATASIDGARAVRLPVTPDIEPGRHRVVASAPGYRAQTREVEVPEGSTLPIEFVLEPVEAQLTVRGPTGADLYIDGERIGRLPARSRVTVAPGPHQVGVAQRGRTLFVRQVELGNGERERIDARLERTGQRKVAFAAIGVGASAAAASIVLMGLAFDAQRRAKKISNERDQNGVTDARWEIEQHLVARRDSLRTAAIATGVTGLGVAAIGIILWLTDRPPVGSQLQRPQRVRKSQASIRPALGFGGASLRGAF